MTAEQFKTLPMLVTPKVTAQALGTSVKKLREYESAEFKPYLTKGGHRRYYKIQLARLWVSRSEGHGAR